MALLLKPYDLDICWDRKQDQTIFKIKVTIFTKPNPGFGLVDAASSG